MCGMVFSLSDDGPESQRVDGRVEQDGRPERAGVVERPREDEAGHEVLQHEDEIAPVPRGESEGPHVHEREEHAGDDVGGDAALFLQAAEHETAEKDLLDKGGEKDDDERRQARR